MRCPIFQAGRQSRQGCAASSAILSPMPALRPSQPELYRRWRGA